MNANKQDADGLPELPPPWSLVGMDEDFPVFSAAQMRAYGELCRAAPAGGDARTVPFSDWMEAQHELGELRTMLARSAPAGSGEVDLMVRQLEERAKWFREEKGQDATLLRQCAALLRKLQQGAEYETPSIECYSYDGDQWFDAPDDVELVAGRRTGDTFELMVSHYSIQRKYVVKKAPDSFGDDYEVEPVRAASQGHEGGTNG